MARPGLVRFEILHTLVNFVADCYTSIIFSSIENPFFYYLVIIWIIRLLNIGENLLRISFLKQKSWLHFGHTCNQRRRRDWFSLGVFPI